MENSPENDFLCFGNILKMLFSYKFFTFSQSFSQLPTNFITEDFKIYTLTQPKIKIKAFIHNIYMIYSVRGGRKSDKLREREIDPERERSEWWRTAVAKLGGFGGGVEWAGDRWRLDRRR